MFPVVFALASKLNVQLFIATHSIEAIDAILRYGNYENNNSNIDPIKVITLKKVDSNNGNGKFAHFVEQHHVNNMITEQDISSLMVVTDRDEASDAKIGRVINNSFENISTKAGQWINNSITDSFGQSKNINTYLLIIPASEKATVGTFFSIRNPQNAMRSFGTFISKIAWSKSESLKELFLPFMYLGEEKPTEN